MWRARGAPGYAKQRTVWKVLLPLLRSANVCLRDVPFVHASCRKLGGYFIRLASLDYDWKRRFDA